MIKLISDETVNFVDNFFGVKPDVVIVLGSGVKALENLENEKKLSFEDIPNFPRSTVAGHAGVISIGNYKNSVVAVIRGRFHKYEGHDWKNVIAPIALMHALGVKNVILTNAAGGINRNYTPSDLMLIEDHINFHQQDEDERANLNKFLTNKRMGSFFDKEFNKIAMQASLDTGVLLHQGIYLSLPGPAYETRGEILAFRKINADAVGMSTSPEAVWGTAIGMRVMGISCITNSTYYAKAMSETSHQEVIDVAKKASENIDNLLKAIVEKIKA